MIRLMGAEDAAGGVISSTAIRAPLMASLRRILETGKRGEETDAGGQGRPA